MPLNIAQPTADPTEYFKKNPAVPYSDYFTPRYTSPSTPAPALATATPLATATSTPTAPPIPSPIQTYYESLNKTAPTVQDEESIREGIRKQMQSSIDAIEAQYSNIISREQVAGEDRSGQTRAINARSGLAGSDFAQANQDKTTDLNKQAIKSIQDEKNLRIQGLYEKIDNRAREEIQARKAEALGNAQQYIGYLEKAQAEARGDLKDISKSGAVLSPDQKAALQKQAGYDDFTFESIINANKPKASQVDYQFKIEGGKIFGYGVDPATGELKTVEKDLGIDIPNNYKPTVTPDGTLILTPDKFDQSKPIKDQIIVYGQEGQFAKPEKPDISNAKKEYNDYIADEVARGTATNKLISFDEWQTRDANRKRSTSTTIVNQSGLTPYQQFQATQELSKNLQKNTTAVREVQRQYGLMQTAYNRLARGEASDLNATTQTVITTFNKILDPNSVVRESEYARSTDGQALLSTLEGKAIALSQGGPGLTKQSLKEFVDLAGSFNQKAIGSLQSEQKRIEANAKVFGLNPDLVIGDSRISETSLEQLAKEKGFDLASAKKQGYSDEEIRQALNNR